MRDLVCELLKCSLTAPASHWIGWPKNCLKINHLIVSCVAVFHSHCFLKSWFLPKAEMNAGFQEEANNLVWLSWLSCWKCWWQPPCCDKSTRKNKKDGGTFVEELETPIVDADLGKQRILVFIAKWKFHFPFLETKQQKVQLGVKEGASYSKWLVLDVKYKTCAHIPTISSEVFGNTLISIYTYLSLLQKAFKWNAWPKGWGMKSISSLKESVSHC